MKEKKKKEEIMKFLCSQVGLFAFFSECLEYLSYLHAAFGYLGWWRNTANLRGRKRKFREKNRLKKGRKEKIDGKMN